MRWPILALPTLVATLMHSPVWATTYSFSLRDNLIFVPTLIDGHPGVGILDSGTSAIVVDPAFANRNRIRLGASLGLADVSGTKKAAITALHLSSVQAIGVSLRNVNAVSLNMDAYTKSAGSEIDAILGGKVLAGHTVSVDYPGQNIGVTNHPVTCKQSIPFRLKGGVPVVSATARFDKGGAKREFRLMVDLGTRHQAVMLSRAFFALPEGKSLMRSKPAEVVGVGAGGSVSGWRSSIDKLQIGGRSFRNVPYAATYQFSSEKRPFYDGALGVPFWVNGSISFDYKRKMLCLPPR